MTITGDFNLTSQNEPTTHFTGKDGIEIMRLEPSGDIYVHGRLVENDKDVVTAMRSFLASQGY